jgi:hypothetical protein
MPAVRQQRPRRFSYGALPVWAQWTLPFGVALILVVALIAFVEHQTNDVPDEAPVNTPSAIEAQNKEADTLMRQEEAPKIARLKPGVKPADALKAAIVTWLEHQIKIGAYGGPLTHEACTATAGSTAARVAFKCEMVTASVSYPFYGVVIPATGSITYCQKVTPPVYGMAALKLSTACLAT